MRAFWQKSGDPLGDFVRLTFLVEEALERLGAPQGATLGEKLRSVEAYLGRVGLGGGTEGLWRFVRLRNQVIHDRIPLTPEHLEEGSQVVRELLVALKKQGYYSWKEWEDRLEALKASPPEPQFAFVVLEPPEARAPEVGEGRRPKELPRRPWGKRALALPSRSYPPGFLARALGFLKGILP